MISILKIFEIFKIFEILDPGRPLGEQYEEIFRCLRFIFSLHLFDKVLVLFDT